LDTTECRVSHDEKHLYPASRLSNALCLQPSGNTGRLNPFQHDSSSFVLPTSSLLELYITVIRRRDSKNNYQTTTLGHDYYHEWQDINLQRYRNQSSLSNKYSGCRKPKQSAFFSKCNTCSATTLIVYIDHRIPWQHYNRRRTFLLSSPILSNTLANAPCSLN